MARSAQHEVWVALHPWLESNFFYVFIKVFADYADWLSSPFLVGMSGLFPEFPTTMQGKCSNRPLILLIFGQFTRYWAIQFYSRLSAQFGRVSQVI